MNLALLLNLQEARKRVLYEQAAARTSLSAEADARFSLPAKVSIIDLNFVPGVAFDAIGNVELTGDLLGNADRVNNNNNNVALTSQFSLTALLNPRSLASKRPALSSSDLNCRRTDPTIATSPAKRIKTNEDCKKSTHRQGFNGGSSLELQKTIRDNIEKLIYIGKVKHTYAYNISKFYKGKNIQLLRPFTQQGPTPRELGSIYVLRIISKSDKVPTQEPSSHIKTELLRDNSRKFYRLVITSENTHCKQIIKKAYIMSLERALLILFMT
ncbi:hypothetical protein HBI07_219310 [Parastagonospora nodorum]|nr:hypothetical protein HBI07_219310 [Parastagonospora nodorum]